MGAWRLWREGGSHGREEQPSQKIQGILTKSSKTDQPTQRLRLKPFTQIMLADQRVAVEIGSGTRGQNLPFAHDIGAVDDL